MFNLLVTAEEEAWDFPPFHLHERKRFLEYTAEPTATAFRNILDPGVVAKVQSFPTLFMYEKQVGAPGWAGRIDKITASDGGIDVEFTLDRARPIGWEALRPYFGQLGISDAFELDRTHWAIKDRNLLAVLQRLFANGIAGTLARPVATASIDTPNGGPNGSDNMPQCFVIQPFDKGGKFDRRYRETFAPAIGKAGFSPYRVDNDPTVSIPIESIEENIRSSEVCLADVTEKKPNVWFELGFALAAKKDVVIVCQDGAYEHYPFDIQHRHVIGYSGESASDFENLASAITERLVAIRSQQGNRSALSALPVMKETGGLSAHEFSALALIMQHSVGPDDAMSLSWLNREMEQSGFTRIATAVSLHKLLRSNFVEQVTKQDLDAREDYTAFIATATGIEWMLANEDKLQLRTASVAKTGTDDIPF